MSVEEIKRYFDNNPPPEVVEWKAWAKITNTQVFLNYTYMLIDNYKGNIETCPAYWRLKEFYNDMRK